MYISIAHFISFWFLLEQMLYYVVHFYIMNWTLSDTLAVLLLCHLHAVCDSIFLYRDLLPID